MLRALAALVLLGAFFFGAAAAPANADDCTNRYQIVNGQWQKKTNCSGPGGPTAVDRCQKANGGNCTGNALVGALGTEIHNTQDAIKKDDATVGNDQAIVDQAQAWLNHAQSDPGQAADIPNDLTRVQEAKKQLEDDQTALHSEETRLDNLQAQMGAATAAAASNAASVGGPVNAAPDDVAKLTGPPSDPTPAPPSPAQAKSDQGEGATMGGVSVAALAPASLSSQKPAPGDDPMNRPVAMLSESPGVPSAAESATGPAAQFARSAADKMRAGDYKGALEDSLETIRADPNNPLGYLRAAEAYNKLGDYVNAEHMAREAIARDPNNAKSWKNLAWALLKQGKYKEAREAALMAAKLDPSMAEAWAIAAYASEKMGDLTARNEYLAKAAALDPSFKDQLAAALRGEKIYTDDFDEKLAKGGRSGGGAVPWVPLAAAGLALGALAGGVAFWRRRGAPAPAPAAAATAGGLGKYRLDRLIGRGGMGDVYLATDTTLRRQVAVKKITRDFAALGPQARETFMKEARTVAQLHHPAIVDIYDVVEAGDDVYLVFELVSGKTAHQVLVECGGKIPFKRAREILAPVCEALDYAHERQLIHRDLKPANIMVTDQGRIKLMDFGTARSLGMTAAPLAAPAAAPPPDAFARTVHAVGTPGYMAPESETGVVCKEGDVYSLGVTLYELLTGRTPFGHGVGAKEKMTEKFMPASSFVPDLPPAVDAAIARALKASPQERFRTAGEFAASLPA